MKGSARKKSKNAIASFVQKLSKILESPQSQGIISWTEDGSTFSIKSVTRFTQQVLPIFFKHNNFSSFIRQLNMYNFNKIRQTEGQNVYYNEHFRRNSKNEYKNIKRRTVEDKDDMMLYEMGGGGAMARELGEMAKKQRELEGVIKNLVNDNQNLREENAKLSKRIEKNLEKSDKKIQKLLLFMLFGNQQGEEMSETNRLENIAEQPKLQIEMDDQQQSPKSTLANNLFEMLNKRNSSNQLRNLMKGFTDQSKSRKKKKQPEEVPRPIEPASDPTLSIKQNGEQDIDIKLSPIIDDVNLFLNVEAPLSEDNEFPLI